MMISVEVLVVIFIVILASFIRQYFIRKKHPPGPLGFPFVGYLPLQLVQLTFSKFLPTLSLKNYFMEMRQKYGAIWSIDVGNKRMIVLASMDVMTEAFLDNGKLFSARPKYDSFKIISEDGGIVFIDGDIFHNNRQLSVKALRDLGMGKQNLEGKICTEVEDLMERIEKNLSKPILSPGFFVKAVSNIITLLSFDVRNKYEDQEFEDFIENLKVIAHSNRAHDILELFGRILDKKYLRRIFPVVDKFMKSNKEAMEFISKKCHSRINIEGEFSKPNCVFDYFWRYRYQDQPETDSMERFLHIAHTMLDLFMAGTDTTTNLLGFCFLVLGQYPEVQKELRTEIQSFVDNHKLINMEMRKDFPKLLSFIDEMQRYAQLVPLVHHRVTQSCMFKGYKIEDTDMVICDLGNIMRDPQVFQNPDEFNLYRFMDESKTKYLPNKALVPFGIGKRACLGEGIATMELFLFLSKIIQRFNISLPCETKNKYSEIFEGSSGLVHAPLDHEILFELINL